MPYHLVKSGRGWKVEDDKGRTFSNKPLPKKRAEAQMRALYANAYHGGNITSYSDDDGHHILIHGNGFITDVFAKAKKAVFGAVGSTIRAASNIIGKPIRNNYPPSARHLLAKYAKAEVDNVIIRREPIVGALNTALNFISLGKWNEMRSKFAFDKLFHLSMVVQLRNPNAYLIVEKNEVINISDKFKMNSDRMEYMVIPVPKGINFWTFMTKAQQAKGEEFFKYDAFTNNCQIFIDGILSANGINSPEAQQFIMQNVDVMLDDLPEYVSPFARLTTNIAGLANRVLEGEGLDKICCGRCSTTGKGDCSLKGGCGLCGGSNGVMKGQVIMSKKDYLAEHHRLIKFLDDLASKAKRESNKQKAEPEMKGGRPLYCGEKETPRGKRLGTTLECLKKGIGVGLAIAADKETEDTRQAPPAPPAPPAPKQKKYPATIFRIDGEDVSFSENNAPKYREWYEFYMRKDKEERKNSRTMLRTRIQQGDTPAQAIEYVLERREMYGGVVNQEELAKQREAFKQQLTAAAPAGSEYGFQAAGFDPSEGGTKEPCFVNLALDNKEGGLNRRQSSMGYKTPAECANIQEVQNAESRRRQYNNMSGFQKFAQGFLDVITPIADVASNIIPGVSGTVYQMFAPPGSAYYSGSGNEKETRDALRNEFLQTMERVADIVGRSAMRKFREQMMPYYENTKPIITALSYTKQGRKKSPISGKNTQQPLREAVGKRDIRMAKILSEYSQRLQNAAQAYVNKIKEDEAKEMRRIYPIPEGDETKGEGKARGDMFFGLSPQQYLKKVRAAAREAGYDSRKLHLANDGKHKLAIITPDGRTVRFGKLGMKDFHLWKHTDPAKADARRKNYLARSKGIKGDWASDKFSPNSLARAILWNA